jgi:hypothetical protein
VLRLDVVAGTVGIITHNHDTATTANDALADGGKADIALLAREILYNPYFADRDNSALL